MNKLLYSASFSLNLHSFQTSPGNSFQDWLLYAIQPPHWTFMNLLFYELIHFFFQGSDIIHIHLYSTLLFILLSSSTVLIYHQSSSYPTLNLHYVSFYFLFSSLLLILFVYAFTFLSISLISIGKFLCSSFILNISDVNLSNLSHSTLFTFL